MAHRKIEIRGEFGNQSVFLDGIEVHPISVDIHVTAGASLATLTFDFVTIEGEINLKNARAMMGTLEELEQKEQVREDELNGE